jgi:hypothetical protein
MIAEAQIALTHNEYNISNYILTLTGLLFQQKQKLLIINMSKENSFILTHIAHFYFNCCSRVLEKATTASQNLARMYVGMLKKQLR